MKTLKNLVCCLALVVFFFSCKKDQDIKPDIKFDYEISLNESIQFDLISNPTTGYSWEWTNEQSISIVDSTNHSFISDIPDSNICSGGKEIWKFTGIKVGIETLKFEYNRSWEPNSTVEIKEIVVKVK